MNDGTSPTGRRKSIIAAATGAICLVCEPLFHRGTLIDHIPAFWTGVGVVLGVVAGIGLVVTITRSRAIMDRLRNATDFQRFRHAMGMLFLLIIGGVVGGYYARVAVEQNSFLGYDAKRSQLQAVVTGISNGRGGPFANLQPYAGARELQARIDDDLYSRLDPYRQPGRDCLILSVETGRGGVKRTLLPAAFDTRLGTERWVKCDGYPTDFR